MSEKKDKSVQAGDAPEVSPKPAEPVVKVGDVWTSDTSGRKVKVTFIDAAGGWLEHKNQTTGTTGSCGVKAFVSRRRLVERDGKAVS